MNFVWQGIYNPSEAASASTHGAEASIQWHNFAPPALIPIVFLACTVVVFFSYWHERSSVLRPWKVLLAALPQA